MGKSNLKKQTQLFFTNKRKPNLILKFSFLFLKPKLPSYYGTAPGKPLPKAAITKMPPELIFPCSRIALKNYGDRSGFSAAIFLCILDYF